MRMKLGTKTTQSLAFLFAATFFVANQAQAEFVLNRGGWNGLSHQKKSGYIMGVIDRHLILTTTGDEDGSNERPRRQAECLFRLEIDTDDLVQLVDEAYAADASKWSWPPYAIIMRTVSEICE